MNLGQIPAEVRGNIPEALASCQILTCYVWRPAASSARPYAVPPHPAEERSHVPDARPRCSPDTWLSHMTRSRTPSPAEGDKKCPKTLAL